MKNLDLRSVIIGILSSALIFTLYGMRFQDENLGHITVKSILIEAGDNEPAFIMKNIDGKGGTIIGFTDSGSGIITTYSREGIILVNISPTEVNNGNLSIFNMHGKKVIALRVNKDADGTIALYDRYGDLGWTATGKQ